VLLSAIATPRLQGHLQTRTTIRASIAWDLAALRQGGPGSSGLYLETVQRIRTRTADPAGESAFP